LDIRDKLKLYRGKKARVETTKARIQAYQVLLEDPEIEQLGYYLSFREPGMPGSGGGGSMVERSVIHGELTRELVKEWIKEDQSRITLLEIEVAQIEAALKSLTSWEEYIISCKYFENMFWTNIEASFNSEFPQKHDITQDRLKQMNKEALDKLEMILTPFYNQMTKVS
jgi:hypothetical protein